MAQDITIKVLTHILAYFTSFLGPLIVFLVTKEESIKAHAKKAMNWQISFIIYLFVSAFLTIILIGALLLIILLLLDIIFCIIAAVKASKDEVWNYPLSIPFFR